MTRPGGAQERGRGRELHVLQRLLPAAPAAARLARVTTRVACRAWRVPEAADTAVLLASELVTAVVGEGRRGQVVLRVLMTPRRMRVEVHDPTGAVSLPEDGLALRLVQGVCPRCGVEADAAGSRVWAELPLGVSPGPAAPP